MPRLPPPFLDRYEWSGGAEAMLRFGPSDGPTVLAALPFFEEANRTRAAMVDVLRRLAARGIGAALPDLPGTGESPVPTEAATLSAWRMAFAAAAASLPGPVHVIGWRGGALLDVVDAMSHWWLAPLAGTEVVRDLRRVRAASGGVLYAGNRLTDALLADLEAAALPAPARPRVVRLESDAREADARAPGRPLWRAAEPGTDPILQAALAEDIAAWVAKCAG